MHGTCICLFGSFDVIGMGFTRFDSGFSLALTFLYSHVMIGFILG